MSICVKCVGKLYAKGLCRRHYDQSRDWTVHKANQRTKYWQDPGKDKARAAKWRLANLERSRANTRLYVKRNPDKYRAHAHTRRSKVLGSSGQFSEVEWNDLVKVYKYRCACCKSRKKLTIDHIVPLAKVALIQ